MSAEKAAKSKPKTTAKKKEAKPASSKTTAAKAKVKATDKKLEVLTAKNKELEDKVLRLRAEFDNYRRRKEQEIVKLLQYEGQSLIKGLLPIIDDLERVGESVAKENNEAAHTATRKGIEMILTKFRKALSEQGVEAFQSIGEILDAELHDAMMVVQQDGAKEHEITQEYEKGYKYKDKVLRHAKVVVNNK